MQLLINLPPAAMGLLALLIILFPIAFAFYILWIAIGAKGYASIFAYSGGNSFIYRADPRVKFLYAVAAPALASALGLYAGIIVLVATLAVYAFMNNRGKNLRFVLLLMLSVAVPSAWTSAIMFHREFSRFTIPGPKVLFAHPELGVNGLSLLGFEYGAASSLTALVAIASTFILVFTSSPSDILTSMVKSKVPYELAFAMTLALISIPKIMDVASNLKEVLFARGFVYYFAPKGRPARWIYAPYYLALILADFIIDVLRSAENIALAANVRGFRASKRRTFYHDFKMTPGDWVAAALFVGLFVMSIMK